MGSQTDNKGGENPYHQHLETCAQCRENPFGMCPEGDRTLRLAVEQGTPRESDTFLKLFRDRGGE